MNGYAKDLSLRGALNDEALSILLHPKNSQVNSLSVVSVSESRKNALKLNDRIAGYPITSVIKAFELEKSLELVNILLDQNNYSNIRQRCVNHTLTGVRFSDEAKKVEVVIGSPCNQVFVVFKHGDETKWWGNTLGATVMEKAVNLLGIDNKN